MHLSLRRRFFSAPAVLLLAGLAVTAAFTLSAAQMRQPAPLCSDFVASLNVNQSANGSVILTGTLCNDGPGNYSNPSGSLQGFFMVYTWYPPKTPAQGTLKFYNYTDFGTSMKAKECRHIRYEHIIPNFSRWGSFPESATERPGMKEFCVKIEKKGVGFSKCEDTDISNTTKCVDIPFMEKK